MTYLCEFYGLSEVASYWSKIIEINEWQQKRISKIVIENLFRNIAGKIITIFGFSFKANTNDTRESPAINICVDLINEGAHLKIHDPQVKSKEISSGFKTFFNESKKIDKSPDFDNSWDYFQDPIIAATNADAIVIITEWQNYKLLDWQDIEKVMRSPGWIFDTRLIINDEDIRKTNLNLWKLGVNEINH